ncbi:hypothetical protein ACH3XW_27190 [Acanthocheilonema viteae]
MHFLPIILLSSLITWTYGCKSSGLDNNNHRASAAHTAAIPSVGLPFNINQSPIDESSAKELLRFLCNMHPSLCQNFIRITR